MAFSYIAEHISKTLFDPMKLRRDQQWISLGVTAYFASKYAAELGPYPKDFWLKEMSTEPPRFPVSAKMINLLKPMEESAMRPQAVPFYNQAMRVKSTVAVMKWVEKGGEASVTKVLAALKNGLPPDGAGLVKMVQEVGGVDLSKDL